MCLQVNPNIRRDKWTADEDAKLIELVKTFGVGRWAEIARNCDGRTDQQCMGRWRRHLDPNIRRVSGCTVTAVRQQPQQQPACAHRRAAASLIRPRLNQARPITAGAKSH
jgi:hypothetical protein